MSKEQWLRECRRAKRSFSTFKVRGGSWEDRGRGGGREDQRHVQGAMAARAQEGLEELSHIEGQEGQW